MDPIIGGALIGGATGLGQGLLQYYGQQSANKTNIQLAQNAQDYDYKKWQEMNKYNSPVQQMSRLHQAGLNPNLIYGSGNVSGNVTGGQAKAHRTEVKSETANIQLQNMLQALQALTTIRKDQAQIDYINENTKFLGEKIGSETHRRSMLGFDQQHQYTKFWQDHENKRMRNLLNYRQGQTEFYKTKQAKYQSKLSKLELNLSEALKPFGATINDPLILRILLKNGLNPNSLLNHLK